MTCSHTLLSRSLETKNIKRIGGDKITIQNLPVQNRFCAEIIARTRNSEVSNQGLMVTLGDEGVRQ